MLTTKLLQFISDNGLRQWGYTNTSSSHMCRSKIGKKTYSVLCINDFDTKKIIDEKIKKFKIVTGIRWRWNPKRTKPRKYKKLCITPTYAITCYREGFKPFDCEKYSFNFACLKKIANKLNKLKINGLIYKAEKYTGCRNFKKPIRIEKGLVVF